MSSKSGKNVFATNLLTLQNKVKRDSTSYKDEFLQTYQNYESQLQVYLMKPLKQNKQLADTVLFLANVSHCFPVELANYAQQLCDLLRKYATVLHPDMRLAFCRALILIRNKNLIEPQPIFELFFYLFKCSDKLLRKTLYKQLINDVKKMKTKLKQNKKCNQIQCYVFTLVKDSNEKIAKYALNLLINLYKKKIWNDAKTVNVISSACFSRVTKVLRVALRFFSNNKDADDSSDKSDNEDSSDEDEKTPNQVLLALRVGKKTKSREKKANRALKALKKEKKSKKTENYHLEVLNMIYDPQDFAEKLLKEIEKTNESFEMKLMMIDIVARLTGIHNLYIPNFYTFLIRFLTPHQREVMKMLWFAAISSHELMPPEFIEQMLTQIANNFITERNRSEVIAVGLNAIREICARCPLAMSDDLLGDLVQYKTYKDKAVSTAAKSLIQLFRLKNPKMLSRKDRGRPTDEIKEVKVRKYGEEEVISFVPGAEVIEMKTENGKKNGKEKKAGKKLNGENNEEDENDEDQDEDQDEDDGEEEEKEEDDWEECSESEEESDDGEWVDVNHSSDEEMVESDETKAKDEPKIDENEKVQKALEVSTNRIFTQEDFKRIKQEQLRKKVEYTSKNANKRKTININSDSEEEDAEKNGMLPLSSITYINKKRKHDKESRVATIMEGREDRGKFGQRYKDPKLGKSNKEKLKSKSFMMIRHKINRKHKRSFKDKQLALRQALIKQKKLK